MAINGRKFYGDQITQWAFDDQLCQIIRYDKSPDSLLQLMACLVHRRSCLILDQSWPDSFNERLSALVSDIDPDQFSHTVFIATSGSTGEPKLCCHAIDSLFQSVERSLQSISIASTDAIVLSLSPAHMGGLLAVTKAIVTGATLTLTTPWTDAIHGTNHHLIIVPQQIQTLVSVFPNLTPFAIASILIGGDATNPRYRQQLLDLGVPVTISYGLTETCGQITDHLLVGAGVSSGTPLAGVDLSIIDHCVAIKAPTLALGYLQSNGFVSLPLNDGWYVTSDLAEIGSDGQLTIRGRRDLLFNSGAELVSPELVEAHLLESGFIDQVIVVPKPDQRFGLVPVAFIDSDSQLDQLKRYADEQLPLFMRPKAWFIFPESIDQTKKSIRKQCLDYVSGLNSGEIDLK